MNIVPFSCIHCRSKTQNYAVIRFKYYQRVYEHAYGVNHPKEDRVVDAGDVPVFVGDDCIKKMKLFRKHYPARIILSVLTIMICILAMKLNAGLQLCAVPFAGVFVLMAVRHGEYRDRSKKQHRNNIASYGWTKDTAINVDMMYAISVADLISGAVMVIVFIVSFFAKGILLKIMAIALIIICSITLLTSIIGFLIANARPTLKDIEAAARYYIYYDEDILLCDEYDD